DNTAGFRCYHCNVLKTVNYNTIKSQGYSYLIEMLYQCKEKGFKIKEVPIVFVDRCWGDTKISKREIFKGIKTLFRLFFVRIKLGSK
ncbi:MAG: polyprenol monophosphomannose synthase, partial [Candidatus Omnitrophica bacterium]|nr:polyprenol monophosphomannose synthase [Candidatus Omnitrophota bacterium]